MKRILVFCLVAAIVFACNKDKFQTKPQIKITSTSTSIVPTNGSVSVTIEFTDKEGDVTDSVFMVRQRTNKKGPSSTPFGFKIPEFPNSQQGEVFVDLIYANLTLALIPINIPGSGNQKEPDSLNLKFVVKDRAGNKSDTATTHVIVIR